jgi:hypothetical protein
MKTRSKGPPRSLQSILALSPQTCRMAAVLTAQEISRREVEVALGIGQQILLVQAEVRGKVDGHDPSVRTKIGGEEQGGIPVGRADLERFASALPLRERGEIARLLDTDCGRLASLPVEGARQLDLTIADAIHDLVEWYAPQRPGEPVGVADEDLVTCHVTAHEPRDTGAGVGERLLDGEGELLREGAFHRQGVRHGHIPQLINGSTGFRVGRGPGPHSEVEAVLKCSALRKPRVVCFTTG